ncbi:hypothetical protein, partial [Hymenobacter sp. B1770]|uniref:hypothetical protein n=1 Tax=Hymenobacter sp. B1770 TaxID=1718788 RepID=UPI003CF87AE4
SRNTPGRPHPQPPSESAQVQELVVVGLVLVAGRTPGIDGGGHLLHFVAGNFHIVDSCFRIHSKPGVTGHKLIGMHFLQSYACYSAIPFSSSTNAHM